MASLDISYSPAQAHVRKLRSIAVAVAADAIRELGGLVSSDARARTPVGLVATANATGRSVAAEDIFIPHQGDR